MPSIYNLLALDSICGKIEIPSHLPRRGPIMSFSLQTDPFSIAINAASLIVATMQLYMTWNNRLCRVRQTQVVNDLDDAASKSWYVYTQLELL